MVLTANLPEPGSPSASTVPQNISQQTHQGMWTRAVDKHGVHVTLKCEPMLLASIRHII